MFHIQGPSPLVSPSEHILWSLLPLNRSLGQRGREETRGGEEERRRGEEAFGPMWHCRVNAGFRNTATDHVLSTQTEQPDWLKGFESSSCLNDWIYNTVCGLGDFKTRFMGVLTLGLQALMMSKTLFFSWLCRRCASIILFLNEFKNKKWLRWSGHRVPDYKRRGCFNLGLRLYFTAL